MNPKQRSHKFHLERFRLKKLYEVGCKEHYHAKVSNSFPDFDAEVDINSAWSAVAENISVIMNW
jgi:hypothetical protein